MNASLITWMTFASGTLLAIAAMTWAHDGILGYHRRLNLRVRSSTVGWSSGRNSLFLEGQQTDGGLGRALVAKLKRIYDESDLRLDWERCCGLLMAASGTAALVPLLLTGVWWTAPVGFAAGIASCIGFLVHKRRARMRRMLVQLPQALDVVARAIQAGKTIPAAFQIVADDLESPIADEFRRCYEQQHLGVSFESALRNLAQRSLLMEIRIFIVALLVQARSGGNLVELLRDLSGLVQKRLKLEQRVKALTSEGRLQAAVLIVLPTAAFGLLYVLAPDYVAVLLERPSLIVAALTAQLIGAIWIRSCIRIEY
jgi:tight adherence protein B